MEYEGITTKGNKWSCVQDAFTDAIKCCGKDLGNYIRQSVPPRKNANTDLEKVINLPEVKSACVIKDMSYLGRSTGGPAFNLLHKMPKDEVDGVYVVNANVFYKSSKKYTKHCFVYNSTFKGLPGDNVTIEGSLSDNRKERTIMGLEKKDVQDKMSCRNTVDKFLGGRSQITRIYKVCPHPKP